MKPSASDSQVAVPAAAWAAAAASTVATNAAPGEKKPARKM